MYTVLSLYRSYALKQSCKLQFSCNYWIYDGTDDTQTPGTLLGCVNDAVTCILANFKLNFFDFSKTTKLKKASGKEFYV